MNRMSGRTTRLLVRLLDWTVVRVGAESKSDRRHQLGVRGEEEAYFHLRRLGYTIVARNWRSPRRKGELDLVGWEGETLCFIEVKTLRARGEMRAEEQVDFEKQRDLRAVAREFRRRIKVQPPCRFDVVSVYLDPAAGKPEIELIRDAFSVL